MSERERINFLLERDGIEPTVKWVKQTYWLYLKEAVRASRHYESLAEFEKFLKEHGGTEYNQVGHWLT